MHLFYITLYTSLFLAHNPHNHNGMFMTSSSSSLASASVWYLHYPPGGECHNVTFADSSRKLICITGAAVYGPSPAYIGDEMVYLGESAEEFFYYEGNETLGVANDDAAHVATVKVGYIVPNVTECFIQVNGQDCCSCRSCLDVDNNLLGMKGDCTNVPNGRRVTECEPIKAYFPLDLTTNHAGSGQCGSGTDSDTSTTRTTDAPTRAPINYGIVSNDEEWVVPTRPIQDDFDNSDSEEDQGSPEKPGKAHVELVNVNTNDEAVDSLFDPAPSQVQDSGGSWKHTRTTGAVSTSMLALLLFAYHSS